MSRSLYLALVGIFCLFAIQVLVLVLVPLTAAAVGVPGLFIGVLVAIPAGIAVALDILVATVSDRIGRRPSLVAGGLCGVASAGILMLATDFTGLLVGILLFGAQMSLSIGPALAYVTEAASPQQHARVQGYNGAVQGLSALLAALWAGLVADNAALPWGFAAAVGLSALAAGAFWLTPETVRRSQLPNARTLLRGYPKAVRMLLTRPALQLSTLLGLTYGAVIFVAGSAFLPIFVIHELGQSAVVAGALLALRNVVGISISPFFAAVIGRFGLFSTILVTHSIGVIGIAAVAFTRDPSILFVWAVLQGIGISFTAAGSNMLVTSATDSAERALGFAANSLVSRMGWLAAPLVYGALLQSGNMPAMFGAAGLLGIVFIVGITVLGRVALVRRQDSAIEGSPVRS